MKNSAKLKSIIMSLCEAIIGILLLINPIGFTTGIIVFVGIVLVILGIYNVVQYFKEDAQVAAVRQDLTFGLLDLLGGLFCIFNSRWFVTAFSLLTVLYGVAILVSGVAKVQWTVDMVRFKNKKWFWSAISALITVVCGFIILSNPFSSTTVLWMFIAIILIVEAVLDIIGAIFTRE
ncbi:MAG: HdeD family acid-resistance protein [Erysipelotrichaceae bacterium]